MSKPNSGIPQPAATWPGMMATVQAMKDQVDQLTGDTGDLSGRAVTFDDLMVLGILRESDMAKLKLRKHQ